MSLAFALPTAGAAPRSEIAPGESGSTGQEQTSLADAFASLLDAASDASAQPAPDEATVFAAHPAALAPADGEGESTLGDLPSEVTAGIAVPEPPTPSPRPLPEAPAFPTLPTAASEPAQSGEIAGLPTPAPAADPETPVAIFPAEGSATQRPNAEPATPAPVEGLEVASLPAPTPAPPEPATSASSTPPREGAFHLPSVASHEDGSADTPTPERDSQRQSGRGTPDIAREPIVQTAFAHTPESSANAAGPDATALDARSGSNLQTHIAGSPAPRLAHASEDPSPTLLVEPRHAGAANAVREQGLLLANRGGGVARLRLNPPELGAVEVSIRVRGDSVDVRLRFDEPAAHAAAVEMRERLSEGLASRELRMERFEVEQGSRDGRNHSGAEDRGREFAQPGFERGRDGRSELPGYAITAALQTNESSGNAPGLEPASVDLRV